MARVLVVDDDADVRAALRMLLEDDGHSVVELDDGLKVPDIISERGVDLILLDLSMPQVDGFEVLSMLLLDPRSASIPVIVVSARGRPDDKAQAMALGATEYINKPWGDGEVEFRVRMALSKADHQWAEDSKEPVNSSQPQQPHARPATPPAQASEPRQRPPVKPYQPPAPQEYQLPAPQEPPAAEPAPHAASDPAPRVVRRRPRARRIVRRTRRRVA